MGVCLLQKTKKALIARERRCTTHDIGKSARTFAKCVIQLYDDEVSKMADDLRKPSRRTVLSALAERWREAAGTWSLLLHLLCSARTSIGKLSRRRASAMRLRSAVSGAADRDQPCGLAVMDGWRPGAFRILGRSRLTADAGGAYRGSWGRSIDFSGRDGHK